MIMSYVKLCFFSSESIQNQLFIKVFYKLLLHALDFSSFMWFMRQSIWF